MSDDIADIAKDVLIAAPPARVWRALTDHREFGAWFGVALDGPFVAGQPASGTITMKDGRAIRFAIDVVAIDPKHYFAYRWHPYAIDPTVDFTGETPTLVEFTLAAEGDGTRLRVRESGFGAVPAHRRDEALRMNDHGWSIQVENIRAHVER